MYTGKTLCFFVLMVFLIAILITSSSVVFSDTDYRIPEQSNLIVDCSFGEEGKDNCGVQHLFQLANRVMKLLIWLAVSAAGVLLFYRGVMLAVNVFTKGGDQEARNKVQSALKSTLVGLILILGAYLIVKAGFDIIGYNLSDNPFKWDESALPAPGISESVPPQAPAVSPDTQSPQSPLQNCLGCQVKTASVLGVGFKNVRNLCTNKINKPNNVLNQTELCWVSAKVGKDLQKLAGQSDAEWQVTEACPPTVDAAGNSIHSNSCHDPENCTCVDANFTGTAATAENIVAFIVAAKDSGFTAVYEIKDRDRYAAFKGTAQQAGPVVSGLMAEGFSRTEAEKRLDHISSITGDHFSLYNQ